MTGLDELLAGNLYNAITAPFTSAGVPAEMLFLLIFADALALIYMKNKSLGLISITLIVTSTIILPYVAVESQIYFYALMMFGFAVGLYGLFKG